MTMPCSRCKQRKSLFIKNTHPPVCYGCWWDEQHQVSPIPEGELWVVLTVENQHYGEPLNTYPSWRAAWVAASRKLGWRHITRIYPREELR